MLPVHGLLCVKWNAGRNRPPVIFSRIRGIRSRRVVKSTISTLRARAVGVGFVFGCSLPGTCAAMGVMTCIAGPFLSDALAAAGNSRVLRALQLSLHTLTNCAHSCSGLAAARFSSLRALLTSCLRARCRFRRPTPSFTPHTHPAIPSGLARRLQAQWQANSSRS